MPALRRDPRDQRTWAKLRAHLLATTPQPWHCWRCGRLIPDPQHADIGHLIDQSAQPGNLHVALEHSRCNRQAGQALGEERKAQRRKTAPQWVSTELPPPGRNQHADTQSQDTDTQFLPESASFRARGSETG